MVFSSLPSITYAQSKDSQEIESNILITSMYPTIVIAYDLKTHKELVSRRAETPSDIRKDNKTNDNIQER